MIISILIYQKSVMFWITEGRASYHSNLFFCRKSYDFPNIQLESDLNMKRTLGFPLLSSYFFSISPCWHYLLYRFPANKKSLVVAGLILNFLKFFMFLHGTSFRGESMLLFVCFVLSVCSIHSDEELTLTFHCCDFPQSAWSA